MATDPGSTDPDMIRARNRLARLAKQDTVTALFRHRDQLLDDLESNAQTLADTAARTQGQVAAARWLAENPDSFGDLDVAAPVDPAPSWRGRAHARISRTWRSASSNRSGRTGGRRRPGQH